ncbi:MAG TPA: hypothetical protein VF476_13375 [Chitinophagaceae bacterium]
MKYFRRIKLILLLGAMLAIVIPGWILYIDRGHAYTTAEEFLSGKKLSSNKVSITGNALFDQSCRIVEYSSDTIYNVSYYIPLVDSNWTPDKPIRILIKYESGKMAFDEGFKDSVAKMDKVIDSLSKLVSNRHSFSGQHVINLLSWFDPSVEPETQKCLEDKNHIKIDLDKIIIFSVNEKSSLSGMLIVTVFALAIAIMLYLYFKKSPENRSKVIPGQNAL